MTVLKSLSPRSRAVGVLLCLCPVAIAWASLILLAHWPVAWASYVTQALFGWMILATYVAIWGSVIVCARSRKLALFQGIMTTITVAGLVGILELGAVLRLVDWALVMERIAGDGTNYMWSYRLDPTLSFRRLPNQYWSGRPQSDIERGSLMPASLREPIAFTYDSRGYRNTTELDKADVVLIGDSYVEGWYVSDDQTVATRLESYIRRPVANLGVAGYGSKQELIVLHGDAADLKPRVVVWFFFEGNDLYDDQEFENFLLASSPQDSVAHEDGLKRYDGWSKRSFLLNLLRRFRRWSDPILPNWAPYSARLSVPGLEEQIVYFADYAAVPWGDWISTRWDSTRETLYRGVEYCREHDIDLLIAFVPIKFRVYQPFVKFDVENPARSWTTWPIAELFSDFCKSVSVPCLDLTPMFQDAVGKGGMPYAAVDTHWSSEGHDLVARRLAAEIRARGWLGPERVGTIGSKPAAHPKT